MKKVDALNKQHYDSDEEWDGGVDIDGQPLMSQGPSLNWKSLFGTLTNGDNEDALETYLKCSNSYQTGSQKASKCIRDCGTEWERAEFAWLKVEKRLRTILLQALGDKEGGGKEARAFVTAVEALLLQLEQEQREGEGEGDGRGLEKGSEGTSEGTPLPTAMATAHLFPRPARLVRPSCPAISRDDTRHGSPEADSGGIVIVCRAVPQLIVTLLDSAFHRLLLHATCQFHHMHSKSFTDKTTCDTKGQSKNKNKNKSQSKKHNTPSSAGIRATRITPFQSQQGAHSISLVPFVLLQLASLDEERARGATAKGTRKAKGKDKAQNSSPETVIGKENSPRNSQRHSSSHSHGSVLSGDGRGVSTALKQQPQQESPVVSLDDLTLEEKEASQDEEEEKEEEDEGEEDEDEYCLVDIVSGGGGQGHAHSNPIESREGS